MAHYRAVIQGMRGEASRLGSKQSGIDTSTNGWTGGVEVRARLTTNSPAAKGIEHDEFTISATGGSGYCGGQGYIGSVVAGVFYPSEAVKMRVIHEYQMRCALTSKEA